MRSNTVKDEKMERRAAGKWRKRKRRVRNSLTLNHHCHPCHPCDGGRKLASIREADDGENKLQAKKKRQNGTGHCYLGSMHVYIHTFYTRVPNPPNPGEKNL
jgi:hypothetical protein